jgi:hypothetical protein
MEFNCELERKNNQVNEWISRHVNELRSGQKFVYLSTHLRIKIKGKTCEAVRAGKINFYLKPTGRWDITDTNFL